MTQRALVERYVRDHLSMDVRRRIALTRLSGRRRLPLARAVPDFLVIGTQRGGTTSVFKWLSAHPDVHRSLRKETGYFSRYWGEGANWYAAHFPTSVALRARQGRSGVRPSVFEATPDYMLHPHAAERASIVVPQAKIIALLREPVSRARSHHQHSTRLGHEHLPFADAVAAEDERIAALLDRVRREPGYWHPDVSRYSYVQRGMYAAQLEPWRRRFGADRLLVLESERLFREPAAVLSEMLNFLGLRPWSPPEFANFSYNALTQRSDTRASSEGELQEYLTARFAGENALLPEVAAMTPSWQRTT